MNRMSVVAIGALVALGGLGQFGGSGAGIMGPRRASADPVPLTALPEKTQWVLHLDVDALRKTPLADLVRQRIVEPRRAEIEVKLNDIERATGMRFPEQCHDVTLYGTGYEDNAACIIIHGQLDQAKILTFLKASPAFKSTTYNTHEIFQWREKQPTRLMFVAFPGDGLAVVSPSENTVALALDVLDSKSPALKSDSPLAPKPNAGGGVVIYIAATNLAELARLQPSTSPFLAQIESGQIIVAIVDRQLTLRALITCKAEDFAQKMSAIVEGLKAQVSIAASAANPQPQVKAVADLTQNLTTRADGKLFSAEWAVAVDQLDTLLSRLPASPGTASQPVVSPPAAPK